MRILVLGGTVFLSNAVAVEALARGHEVTCAARGRSGDPPEGVTFVRVERDSADGLAALADERYDAVVDVARLPSQVRGAVSALASKAKHWTFVSTISVYSDDRTTGQRTDAPVFDPLPPEVTGAEEADVANYGPAKVACEHAVLDALGDRAFVLRAGLIVGPGDRSDRGSYWPVRLARGGEVLAPGTPADPVQCVDVRDLASWIVLSAEHGVTGTYDGTAPATTRAEFLTRTAEGVGAPAELTWVDQEFLLAHKVNPWAGPRSLPLWLPLPDDAAGMSRDVSPALDAGLVVRDVAETAKDTLAAIRAAGREDQLKAGLTPDEEAELLRAWRSRS
jgi:2'-hydroxyisoflavone reductase